MNSKLFKPLNEQIQVIKIKRQGISDAERDLLIESIINEGIVESLTEDVELASINEDIASYVKRFSNKASRKKNNKKIGKYYKPTEKLYDFLYKPEIKKLQDDIAAKRDKIEQDYNNREINNKDYKMALKNLLKTGEEDLRKKVKDNYMHNLNLAKIKREGNIYLRKDEKKHQKINKKLGDKFNVLNKAFDSIADKKSEEVAPVENKPVEVEKPAKDNYDYYKTMNDFNNRTIVKEEKPKVVKGDPKKDGYYTTVDFKTSNAVKEEKPAENKPAETNRDEEFEKRVAAETEKRYQAKLDADAKKKQERQAEINEKRRKTYEANRLKKAAEAKVQKEPVENKPVASETPAENKPVETEKPAETEENKQ